MEIHQKNKNIYLALLNIDLTWLGKTYVPEH